MVGLTMAGLETCVRLLATSRSRCVVSTGRADPNIEDGLTSASRESVDAVSTVRGFNSSRFLGSDKHQLVVQQLSNPQ